MPENESPGLIYIDRRPFDAAAARRNTAWLPVPLEVCGIRVRPLTPLTWRMLVEARNRVLLCEPADAADLAEFVWAISDLFEPGDRNGGRQKVIEAVAAAFVAGGAESAFAAAAEIVHDAFADAPPHDPSATASDSESPVAALVDLLASEYGWPVREILNTPLAQLWQLFRAITARRSGGRRRPPPTRSELSAIAAALRKRMAERASPQADAAS